MTDAFTLTREMGCTAAEFLHWLPGATRGAPMTIAGGEAVLRLADGTVSIRFEQGPPRQVARIELPVLRVAFRFDRIAAPERHAFLEYFDLYTRRGGG